MSCNSAYVSYHFGGDENVLVNPVSRPVQALKASVPQASTSFVLVDPSNSTSKAAGKDAKKSIRKHASKACAAQRLATIAEKKKAQNVLTKRERQRQQAAERLQAALERHALKFSPVKEEYPDGLKAESTSSCEDGVESDTRPSGLLDTQLSRYSPDDGRRKKCSIPWMLSTSSLYGKVRNPTATLCDTNSERDEQKRPPGPLDIYSPQLGPPAYTTWSLEIDGSMRFLLNFMFHHQFPMMDLRLPHKADKLTRNRYAWRNDLPSLVLSSEPFFWTILLCAGTLQVLWKGLHPSSFSSIMRYRHLAICSVNRRLQATEEDLVLDSGLISAVATLGVWERQRGSKEIWVAHLRGVETLTQKLRERKEHHLERQLVASCYLPDIQPLVDNHSEGFKRLSSEILLDNMLVSSICRCAEIDLMHPGQSRFAALEAEATEMLKYTTSSAVSGRLENSAGCHNSLETNILVQGAGVSLIKFLRRDGVEIAIDRIDFLEMCREAVWLAKSISTNPAYDELLLWAMFTMYALNRYTKSDGFIVIAKIARRLEIAQWQSLENLLRSYAYLDSGRSAYHETWSVLVSHLRSTG